MKHGIQFITKPATTKFVTWVEISIKSPSSSSLMVDVEWLWSHQDHVLQLSYYQPATLCPTESVAQKGHFWGAWWLDQELLSSDMFTHLLGSPKKLLTLKCLRNFWQNCTNQTQSIVRKNSDHQIVFKNTKMFIFHLAFDTEEATFT